MFMWVDFDLVIKKSIGDEIIFGIYFVLSYV